MSALELGIVLEFSGEGTEEFARVTAITSNYVKSINVGDIIVQVDERYFRPAEVETLLGDPTKAKQQLGWIPEITVEEMCSEMVANDLDKAKRHAFLKENGYEVTVTVES